MTAPTQAWDWAKFRAQVAAPLAEQAPASLGRVGKYRVIAEIAQGAMGVVYEAEDPELQRIVALKILRDFAGSKEIVRRRFQREALAAAKLNHPNVVRVYDAGEADGRMFLVMELVRGRPLSGILGGRTQDLRSLLVLLEKTARGLSAAHDAGIVHRDVKPANILVTEAGEPKVGDFGLAHWMDSETQLTKSGTPLGTPMYMSPEQVRGSAGEIRPSTDVYALGGILYEILTGRPPHTGENTAEIYSKIVGDDPVPPRKLSARVSWELETICLKALEKEPARRYPDAKAFADDLRRHLDGESIVAKPPGAVSRGAKWVRRHRVKSAAAAVGLAGIAAVAIVFIAHARERNRGAAEWVARGRAHLEDFRSGSADLDRLSRDLGELSDRIDPVSGQEVKQPLWDLQQTVDRKRVEVETARREAERAFTRAVGIDSRNADAFAALAGLYFARFEEAERAGDREAMASNDSLVRLFDPGGTYASRLALEGRLAIDSIPPGAEAELLTYEAGKDLRLIAVSPRKLGRCPLPAATLPAGSYLVVLRLAGYRDTLYPVLIGRGTDHAAKVRLHTDAEIGDGFVLVPGGPFIRGGDPESISGGERREASAEGFVISRLEVTWEEYIPFLRALLRDGATEEARRRAPRASPGSGYLVTVSEEGRLLVRPEVEPRWPIFGVSWDDAVAWTRWRTRLAAERGEKESFRLPTPGEWEKAARGADGRFFPWGNYFDWTFTLGGVSRGQALARPVGSFEKDASPYGVIDLGGSVSEWCDGWNNERFGTKVVRGGGWNFMDSGAYRSSNTSGATANLPSLGVGFRVVKVPDRGH